MSNISKKEEIMKAVFLNSTLIMAHMFHRIILIFEVTLWSKCELII